MEYRPASLHLSATPPSSASPSLLTQPIHSRIVDDIEIAVDDPALPDVRAVIERHLAFANSIAEPQDVHAMGATALSDPTITFFSARRAGSVLAIGALKRPQRRDVSG